jgi:hypothetical protein
MAPVRFETHCKACHPLDFDEKLPPVPHGLQPADVTRALWQSYSARYVQDHKDMAEEIPTPRPVPGKGETAEVRKARELIGHSVSQAERSLFGGKKCGECHVFLAKGGSEVTLLAATDSKEGVRVGPPNVPDVWLTHARFDHSAHLRVAECRACHPKAFDDDPNPSRSSDDIMIPGIAECQKCHAPKGTKGASATVVAGSSCTECHTYHGGDQTKLGPGDLPNKVPAKRDAALEAGLRGFLAGKP